jgi:hypothetical protein
MIWWLCRMICIGGRSGSRRLAVSGEAAFLRKGDLRMDIVDLSIKVVAQAASKPLQAHGIPGGAIITEAFLRQLLLVQDQQAEALSRIDKNVQRLIDGPWRTARLYVDEAAVEGLPAAVVHQKLSLAAQQLRIAVPLQEDRAFGRAYACIDLAIVLTMLRDDAAVLYARQAMAAATHFLLDIESGRRNPPNTMRDLQVGNLMNVKNVFFHKRRRSRWEVIAAPFLSDFTYFDRRSNAWLDSIYTEFNKIEYASVALSGGGDAEVSSYRQHAPRDLRFNRGVLNSKNGLYWNIMRKLSISFEE